MERGEGGELTREKVRGAMLHKAGQKYRLSVSPDYKLYYTPVKTTFRAWCLYSSFVHGLPAPHVPSRPTQRQICAYMRRLAAQ
jgi:hypothetical protein